MTQVGSVYGEALYDLAKSERLSQKILQELTVLEESFRQSPEFLRLLAAQSLSKQERCAILDDSFRGKLHPYVLNFLKILTEKGYPKHFFDCVTAYREHYNRDNGILPVTAITAAPLSEEQLTRLRQKLAVITGKTIQLTNKLEPSVLGGIRLDYDGKSLDGTIAQRLDAIRKTLKNTAL
ncbi:MAG: ATP synthase F1 subunit delta [Oscillospiraceae bacterium]|nr:ATP synthase F1 subunit delta [Oscillospiraceae bacterium]